MSDDPLSPPVENRIELDRYALSTVVYAERSDGQIVLLERAEGTAMAGLYFLPGGIVDPGEDPWDGAERELAEETGLRLAGPLQMVGCYPMFVYGQEFLQLSFRGPVTGEVATSAEHTNHRWVEPASMTEVLSPEGIAALAGGDPRIESLLRSIAQDLDRYLSMPGPSRPPGVSAEGRNVPGT